EEVRTARVTEAGAARATARVHREAQELAAVHEVGRDELRWCPQPLPRTRPPVEGRRLWHLTAGDLQLDLAAVPDDSDPRPARERVNLSRLRQDCVPADEGRRHRSVERNDADVTTGEARKAIAPNSAEIRVRVWRASDVAPAGILVKAGGVVARDDARRACILCSRVVRIVGNRTLVEPDLDVRRSRLSAVTRRQEDRWREQRTTTAPDRD